MTQAIPVERFIQAGSFRTRYLDVGPQEATRTVLLLHDGAQGGAADVSWGSGLAYFPSDWRVLAPDMLGFGRTDKAIFLDRPTHGFRVDHLADFLESVGVTGPVDVVGTSFGGGVALHAAVLQTFPVRAAVSFMGSGGGWRTELGTEVLGEWDGTRQGVARIVDLLTDSFDGYEDHIDARLAMASSPAAYRALKAAGVDLPEPLRESRQTTWPLPLAGLSIPVLLVRGTRDRVLEPGWADELAALSQLITVEDVNSQHEPNLDQPEVTVDTIVRFLRAAAP